ncbi:esterase [Synechococcus sp. RSCCF101]|uniref:alpha/beta hydrolase n=1 Tax=Synechococcus sp. RSCCF101 TaxID=2511069 RepID=UPI00124692E7|nr:alpha/beta fold hydrolase [Synechococcus sp. RSCCF101]QEY31281.1 esterase [Synechococcus sp. RSCCF101]
MGVTTADPGPISLPAHPDGWLGPDGRVPWRDAPLTVLLLHGFTGSPSSLRPVADQLHARGYGVEAPLLAGHGTRLEDLMPVRRSDWTAQVAQWCEQLGKRGPLVLGGLSLGALLALQEGLRQGGPSGRLRGLLLFAPPIGVRDPRRFLAPLLVRLVTTLPKQTDWFADPDAAAGMWSYDRFPAACSMELLRLMGEVRRQCRALARPVLPLPTLLVGSRRDPVVSATGLEWLAQRLDPTISRLHWLDRSGHVLTLDLQWPELADLSLAALASWS